MNKNDAQIRIVQDNEQFGVRVQDAPAPNWFEGFVSPHAHALRKLRERGKEKDLENKIEVGLQERATIYELDANINIERRSRVYKHDSNDNRKGMDSDLGNDILDATSKFYDFCDIVNRNEKFDDDGKRKLLQNAEDRYNILISDLQAKYSPNHKL